MLTLPNPYPQPDFSLWKTVASLLILARLLTVAIAINLFASYVNTMCHAYRPVSVPVSVIIYYIAATESSVAYKKKSFWESWTFNPVSPISPTRLFVRCI